MQAKIVHSSIREHGLWKFNNSLFHPRKSAMKGGRAYLPFRPCLPSLPWSAGLYGHVRRHSFPIGIRPLKGSLSCLKGSSSVILPTSVGALLPDLPRRNPLRLLQVEKQSARHNRTIGPKSNDRLGLMGPFLRLPGSLFFHVSPRTVKIVLLHVIVVHRTVVRAFPCIPVAAGVVTFVPVQHEVQKCAARSETEGEKQAEEQAFEDGLRSVHDCNVYDEAVKVGIYFYPAIPCPSRPSSFGRSGGNA